LQGSSTFPIDRSEAAAPAVAVQRSRRRKWPISEWLLFLLFIAPNFILFSVFTYWPMIQTAYLSGVRWDMISPQKRWVGAANYRYLFEDDTFRQVLINSFWFAIGAVGGSLILGLAIAILLDQRLRFRNFARASVFMPTLLSGAAIGIVWVYIFDPRYGIIAGFLRQIGLNSPSWLGDPKWALPAVIIVYIWKNVGLAAVIFLAGLQSIPRDLYEAATVDGAGAMSKFRNVTIPMLSPIMFFVVVTSILNSFQAFDIINVMTRGGPVDATNILIYYIYEQGFVAFNAGRAGAASMVLFVIMLAITLMQLRFSERRVHYG
jgi:multiple sugar transport system permease protein/sn-glycerol 3-phosphate transport system permease protein